MSVTYTVHVDGVDKIQSRLAQSCTQTEHTLAVQIEKDTQPFVPALTGSLTQRTRVIGNTIVYPAPYARYLYFGKLMVDPDTGSAWAKAGASKVLTDRNLVFTKTMHRQAQSHWFEASKALNRDKWLRIAEKAVKKNGK